MLEYQLETVRRWHKAFGVPILPRREEGPTKERFDLRKKLVIEEATEMAEAYEEDDLAHFIKELADVEYVCLGMCLEMGWRRIAPAKLTDHDDDTLIALISATARHLQFLQHINTILGATLAIRQRCISEGDWLRAWTELCRSNMSKLGDDGKPVLREDGKILKGKNYSPADLSFLNK